MTRLRKKLSTAGAPQPSIKAVHKVGYTLACQIILE